MSAVTERRAAASASATNARINIMFSKFFLSIFLTAVLLSGIFFYFNQAALAAQVTTDYLFGGDATNVQSLAEQSGLGLQDPRATVAKVINITLAFLGVIAVVLIVIAGFLWMTAAGNEEKIATAKKLMAGGVIGLIIVLAAFGIARFVINSLISATGADSGGSGGSASRQTALTQSQTSPALNSAAGNLNSGGSGGLLSNETEIITPGNITAEQIITGVEVSIITN